MHESNYVLSTRGLNYSFSRDEPVLREVGLSVEEGSIYGFLGPNGAGKTTTLRLVLGLLKNQEGKISIFGRDFVSHRLKTLSDIGSMIESPSIYAHLTAEENLRVLNQIYRAPRSRITEVLRLVGLRDTGRKKAGQFSLGMKQRLSLAIALLPWPKLLILDEPTNGLDPNGIIEIRELLRQLNTEFEMTVLVSSHLLAEIDRLVSHIGIIHRGRMMFQGTLDELKKQQQRHTHVVLETSDNESAAAVLRSEDITAEMSDGHLMLPALEKSEIANVARKLVDRKIDIYEISNTKSDLERIFIDMVSE